MNPGILSQDYSYHMNYLQSFRLDRKTVRLAAVGAGGKSSFLFQIARQLPGKKIITTTTHISLEQSYDGDMRLIGDDPALVQKIISAPENTVIVIVGTKEEQNRVNGPDKVILDELHRKLLQEEVSILLEADGSKMRPLKAFADHEPVVPDWIDLIVHIVGWNAIGKRVNQDTIFRVDKYCEFSGQRTGEVINFHSIVNMLLHPKGGRKVINKEQKGIILINQFPGIDWINHGIEDEMKRLIPVYDRIVFGNTKNEMDDQIFACYENISAVILAAGGSSRMGEGTIKQLLEYDGKSFLERSVDLTLKCGFSSVFVVLGHAFETLANLLKDKSIEIIRNENWASGQSSSVIAAASKLLDLPDIGGAIFIPIDQPYLDEDTINRIVRCHTTHIGKTIVPRFEKEAGSPVLFDRDFFDNLLLLKGDKGGRSILNSIPVQYCDIQNEFILKDIDTQEDYNHLINN